MRGLEYSKYALVALSIVGSAILLTACGGEQVVEEQSEETIMTEHSVNLTMITTENGAVGEQGYVTQHSVLKSEQFDQVYTCGPKPMMVAVARWAKGAGVACEVSLENKMACGVGACLCCVEDTKEGHVCVCSEGPVFSIDKLSWQI